MKAYKLYEMFSFEEEYFIKKTDAIKRAEQIIASGKGYDGERWADCFEIKQITIKRPKKKKVKYRK